MSPQPHDKSSRTDWDREDIIAALHKRGLSLIDLARRAGYTRNTVRDALDRPYLRCEAIIAEALGVSPETIWPSRYVRRANRKQRAEASE
jgi:Ner family transcriptional regulator